MHIDSNYFKSKIDWWFYATIPFIIIVCMLGPIISKSGYLLGIISALIFVAFIVSLILDTRYVVKDNKLDIKYLCHWQWFPIGKIESIRSTNSRSVAAVLSTKRIAINFKTKIY